MKPTQITRGYITITPTTAQEMLDTSIGNRPINSKKVAQYMQDMASGEWNRDSHSIYFDERGHLMDGHTRLAAVVKSGATIEAMVVRGFPRADWDKLNRGGVWTVGDFAGANHVKDPNIAMAAIKIREALKRGLRIGTLGTASRGSVNGKVWTNDDYLRLYHEDAQWQDDVEFGMAMWRHWRGISASVCAGIVHHLTKDRYWPRDFVLEFFRQCYTLEGITVNARTLRKRLDIDRASGATLQGNYVCLLIAKAFDGYAANVPKTKLQVNDMLATPTFPKMKKIA